MTNLEVFLLIAVLLILIGGGVIQTNAGNKT